MTKIYYINQITRTQSKPPTTAFHSTTLLLWKRIHQAWVLTKKRMHRVEVEALVEIELKSISINNKTWFIQPSRILSEMTIATQWTCDDITLSSLLFIHHSSKRVKRNNNTNKESRRTNNLPNNKKFGFSKLGIGSKYGNNSSYENCTSRRENKRDQMTANKIA